MRSHAAILSCAVLLILSAPSWPEPATAAYAPEPDEIDRPPPAGFSSWIDVYRRQERLIEQLAPLYDAAQVNKLSAAPDAVAASGFAGIAIDVAANEINLYWHGPLPAEMQAALLDAYSRDSGIVNIVPAPHSRQQLSREMQSWLRVPGVVRVVQKEDGTGLLVSVGRSAAEGVLQRAAGTAAPYEVEYDHQLSDLLLTGPAANSGGDSATNACGPTRTRKCDKVPFYSGSRYWHVDVQQNVGVGACTLGFPLRYGPSWAYDGMATAGHCFDHKDYDLVINADLKLIGQTDVGDIPFALRKAADAARVEMVDDVAPRGYTGSWNSGTNRGIAGVQFTHVAGAYVRSSGASTGSHDLYVTSTNVAGADGFFDMVLGMRMDHESCAAGAGDSGGFVFTPSGVDTDPRIRLHGIISLGAKKPGLHCGHDPMITDDDLRYYILYHKAYDVVSVLKAVVPICADPKKGDYCH